jgi:hypothetical protein
MLEIKKKFVYVINSLKKFHGMIPLDVYMTLIYFNYNEDDEECKKIFLNTGELLCFLTECISEVLISEINIDPKKFNPELKDFYLSTIPQFQADEFKKILVFKTSDKQIIISEDSIDNHHSLKMKNLSKEQLLSTIFSVQNLVTCIFSDLLKKFTKAKGLKAVDIGKNKENLDQESEIYEINENKFDKSNYIQL